MTSFSDWLKAIQLKPRFLFGLCLLGCLLLGLPDKVADMLGWVQIRNQYRPWIGIGTLGAFTFWLVQLIPSLKAWKQGRRNRWAVLNTLYSLSNDESILLAYCLANNQQTICLPIINPTALALSQKGLLEQKRGTTNMVSSPHMIPSFVWMYLKQRRHEILPEHLSDEMQKAIQEIASNAHKNDEW